MRALMTWLGHQADPMIWGPGHSEPIEFLAVAAAWLVAWLLIMRPILVDPHPQPE